MQADNDETEEGEQKDPKLEVEHMLLAHKHPPGDSGGN